MCKEPYRSPENDADLLHLNECFEQPWSKRSLGCWVWGCEVVSAHALVSDCVQSLWTCKCGQLHRAQPSTPISCLCVYSLWPIFLCVHAVYSQSEVTLTLMFYFYSKHILNKKILWTVKYASFNCGLRCPNINMFLSLNVVGIPRMIGVLWETEDKCVCISVAVSKWELAGKRVMRLQQNHVPVRNAPYTSNPSTIIVLLWPDWIERWPQEMHQLLHNISLFQTKGDCRHFCFFKLQLWIAWIGNK